MDACVRYKVRLYRWLVCYHCYGCLELRITKEITGASLEIIGTPTEALKAYEFGLPYTMNTASSTSGGLELRTWTELFLGRLCMLTNRQSRSTEKDSERPQWTLQPERALVPFRAWARFWEHSGPLEGPPNTSNLDNTIRRRDVWRAYYDTFSMIVQAGSPYPMAVQELDSFGSSAQVSQNGEVMRTRTQLYMEFHRVEKFYENLLLKEVSFPRAGTINVEVDDWVNQVMANWKVICGPTWQDEDLGQDGQEIAGRNVLDVSTAKWRPQRLLDLDLV